MVIKITARYTDSELGREPRIGEVLTVSDERGEMLIKRKVAEKIGDGADPAQIAELQAEIKALKAENAALKKAAK